MLAAIAHSCAPGFDRGCILQVAMNISALDLAERALSPERITMILQAQELTPDYASP